MREQLHLTVAVLGEDRGADRGANIQRMPLNLKGKLHGPDHAAGDNLDFGFRHSTRQHHYEFVATHARQRINVAHAVS